MKTLNQKGFAALFVTVLILTIVFSIIVSIAVLTFNQHKISRNIIKSSQAYYLAESGIEDALLRIKNNVSLNNFSYSFEITGGNVEIYVSENIGGALTIISNGEFLDSVRKIKVVYEIDFESVSFYYGAQVGEGGIIMQNNSKIKGNVFSNGNILGFNGSEITDSVIVAGEKIDGIKVGKDAKVYNCYNSEINGNLFYIEGTTNCSVIGQTYQTEDIINPEDFIISKETIEKWGKQAKEGEIIPGDYNVIGEKFLGPAHIQGNLTLNIKSNLKMQGTIFVSGDLKIENLAVLELDQNYYQMVSGILIVEGKSQIKNGSILRGSGQPGSYLMIISLNNSLEDAIQLYNTSDAGIFFAPYGTILMNQRVKIKEAMAYKIILQERAEIEYEIGLNNIFFSSGAGGSWKVLSWKEI